MFAKHSTKHAQASADLETAFARFEVIQSELVSLQVQFVLEKIIGCKDVCPLTGLICCEHFWRRTY
jgi:hypothetical protein